MGMRKKKTMGILRWKCMMTSYDSKNKRMRRRKGTRILGGNEGGVLLM